MALRKRVTEKSNKKTNECHSMSFIQDDDSIHKDVSHLQLKAIVLQNPSFYKEFKKAELIHILKAYGKTETMKSNKIQLGQELVHVLQSDECAKMFNSEVFEVQPSTCTYKNLEPKQPEKPVENVLKDNELAVISGDPRESTRICTSVSPENEIKSNENTTVSQNKKKQSFKGKNV